MHYLLQRTDTSAYRGGDGGWHADINLAMKWLDQSEAAQCALSLSKQLGVTVAAVPQ